jgi:hypothetical protein
MGNRFVTRFSPVVMILHSGMINTTVQIMARLNIHALCQRVNPVPSSRYREIEMKSFLLMTGSGPLVILTSYTFIQDATLLEALLLKGIDKFVAYEIPLELAKDRYGGHYTAVINDWLETEDLRVLDFNGERAFRLFSFSELGEAQIREP